MTVIRTTRIVGALGAVALAAALLPGAAAGSDPVTIGGGGVLRLHLGADGDKLLYEPPTGSGELPATQTISTRKCVASLSPPASLVTLTPTPEAASVGLFDHGLGVKGSSDGTGTPCGRVDGPSQALTLSLGETLAGKLIDFAELDIEAKFDVLVRAQAYLGGSIVATETLPSGSGSDSGPDSADGDNYRWLVDPASPFDTLVLSVDPSTPGGAFSLEGGADGTAPGDLGAAFPTSDSLFQLEDVTGVLDCGESSPTIGGDGTPTADLTRGQNANCQKIPYLLRTDKTGSAQSVLLQKRLGDQTGANFTMTIVWEPELASNPLQATTIDYGQGRQDVQWCGGTPGSPTLPSGQAWCLTSQQAALAGGGNVQVTEGYFGAGDPIWAR
jgi:hypothetical protein